MNKCMTVGDLKKIVEELPDDMVVAIVDGHKVRIVTSCGHLACDWEEHDALAFYASQVFNGKPAKTIDEETQFCKEILF